jgi:hypothetical protein
MTYVCQKCKEDGTKNNETSLIQSSKLMRTLTVGGPRNRSLSAFTWQFQCCLLQMLVHYFLQQLLLVITSELCQLCDSGEDMHYC